MSGDGIRAGDVIRYVPVDRWCHEGTAIAVQRGDEVLLFDTYWGGYDPKRVEPQEFEVLFNVDDYDELPRYDRGSGDAWAKYARSDRQVITSQHGLQRRYFVRKGADEDVATQIENARQRLADAESELDSAQWRRDSARRELAELESAAASA